MMKFLFFAPIGLFALSTATAGEIPQGTNQESTHYGDEGSYSCDAPVVCCVRVPLTIQVEDASITFPCLRRPLSSYATHGNAGYSSEWVIDPSNAGQQSLGNTAKIRVKGDADDRVRLTVEGTDVTAGVLRLRHVNTVNQYSTGPHNPPTPSGANSNPDYLDVKLKFYASQVGNPDQNYEDNSGPNYGPAWVGTGYGPMVLSHYDLGGTQGVGGLRIWFGGSVATKPGQQRGLYCGKFKVRLDYMN